MPSRGKGIPGRLAPEEESRDFFHVFTSTPTIEPAKKQVIHRTTQRYAEQPDLTGRKSGRI